MPTPRENLAQLHTDADAVTAGGGRMTDRFATIRARWDTLVSYVYEDHPAPLADLATAEDEPTPEAWREAVVATFARGGKPDPATAADALNSAAAALLPAQRAEFATVAGDNYTAAAQAYDKAAAALVAALGVVNPDTPAEDLMGAPEKTRRAWADVPSLVAAVERAAEHLRICASAAEVPTDDAHTFALYVAVPTDAPADRRRELWAAWDVPTGRAGRWGAVVAQGATLAAPAAVEDVKPYRRPRPVETRYRRVEMGMRAVEYDPETDTPADAIPAGGNL